MQGLGPRGRSTSSLEKVQLWLKTLSLLTLVDSWNAFPFLENSYQGARHRTRLLFVEIELLRRLSLSRRLQLFLRNVALALHFLQPSLPILQVVEGQKGWWGRQWHAQGLHGEVDAHGGGGRLDQALHQGVQGVQVVAERVQGAVEDCQPVVECLRWVFCYPGWESLSIVAIQFGVFDGRNHSPSPIITSNNSKIHWKSQGKMILEESGVIIIFKPM